MSKILFYKCKKCGTKIPPETGGIFKRCKCGKICIRGDHFETLVRGDVDYVSPVYEIEKNEFVYRIKQVATGLFYRPKTHRNRGYFSPIGKFYTKTPSLSWVEGMGECVIEKYRVEKVTNQ